MGFKFLFFSYFSRVADTMMESKLRGGEPSVARGDGDGPSAGLIADRAGNLYGTTSRGGAWGTWGNGVVFKLSGTRFVP
jgi:uncharacterized repeat protein (TIGR03803 family)